MRLALELNKIQAALMEALLKTGLYGFSIEDVATRILDAGLRNEMKEGAFPEVVDKKSECCPGCGSPNIRPAITMGGHDVECADCNRKLTYAELQLK